MSVETILNEACLDETYWGKKIIAAEKRGYFTTSNYDQSAGWQTCACGRQDSRIERWHNGRPMDALLQQLGENFQVEVEADSYHQAARTLIEIEQRAVEVIADQVSKSMAIKMKRLSDAV